MGVFFNVALQVAKCKWAGESLQYFFNFYLGE